MLDTSIYRQPQNLGNLGESFMAGQQAAQQQRAQQQDSQIREMQIQEHQQKIQAEKAEQVLDQRVRALFGGDTPPTPEAIYSTVGPERGGKIIQGLAALRKENQAAYTSQAELIRDVLAGMDALPEGVRAESYPAVRKTLLDRQLINAQDVPEAYDPDWFRQARDFGKKPVEPKAAGTREIKVRNPDGSETVQIVPDTAGQSFTSAAVPDKAPPVGGFEDYLGHYAAERHLNSTQLSTKDIEQARRTFEAAGRAPVQGADDSVPNLTPAALDLTAKQFAMTGLLPPMGMGKAGAAVRAKIINRAAEQYQNLDLASQRSAYEASKDSLKKLQVQRDAMGAFEETALKNLDVFIAAAGKIKDTGSPLLNKPLRSISESVMGSPEMTAYQTARRTVIPEFAKILATPGLSGQLSDSARREVEDVVRGDATLAQIMAAAKVLTTDVKNRTTAYDDQIKAIQTRIATPPGGKASEPTVVPSQPATAPASGAPSYQDYLKRRGGG